MTIVIGIRVREGAVFASDCRTVNLPDGTLEQMEKLRGAVHCSPPSVSGLLLAVSGEYNVDVPCPGDYLLQAAARSPDNAYLLADEFLLERRTSQAAPIRSLALLKTALDERDRTLAYREVRGTKHGVYDISFLRFSTRRETELGILENGKLRMTRSWLVTGSGQDIARIQLQPEYNEHMPLDDAIALCSAALTDCISHPDYEGYQVAVVFQGARRHLDVRWAQDLHAKAVPQTLDFTDYLATHSHPVTRSEPAHLAARM